MAQPNVISPQIAAHGARMGENDNRSLDTVQRACVGAVRCSYRAQPHYVAMGSDDTGAEYSMMGSG